jgi:hypothetical protein
MWGGPPGPRGSSGTRFSPAKAEDGVVPKGDEISRTVPFALPAFGSWVDSSAHRDGLYLTTATYK